MVRESSRPRFFLLAFLICCSLLTANAFGQSIPAPFSNTWIPWNNSQFSVTTSALIGVENFGINFNLPTSFSALDLSLRRSVLPLGRFGLLVNFGDRFTLFANAEGTLSKNVSFQTKDEPFGATIDWNGSRLRHGSLELGFLYDLSAYNPYDLSVIGGLRWYKLSATFDGPSFNYSAAGSKPLGPFSTLDYSHSSSNGYDGDINVPIFIPYFGLQLSGANYRATFVGSPFASVQLKLPFDSYQSQSLNISAGNTFPTCKTRFWLLWVLDYQRSESEATQLSYQFDKSGIFLEGTFDYDMYKSSRFGLSFWSRGQFMSFRGNGTTGWSIDGQEKMTFSIQADFWRFRQGGWHFLTNFWDVSAANSFNYSANGSDSGRGSLNIYNCAFGISGSVAF